MAVLETAPSRIRTQDLSGEEWFALYRDLVARVGVVEDPFRRQATARWAANALRVMQDLHGEEGLERLRAIVNEKHLPRSAQARDRFWTVLADEHAWIDVRISIAIAIHGILLTQRLDFFWQAAYRAISDQASTLTRLISVLPLWWAYRHIADTSRNMTATHHLWYDAKATEPGRTVIRMKRSPEYAQEQERLYGELVEGAIQIDCDLTDGSLAAVPLMFGQQAAKTTHIGCEKDGADACEILVEWKDIGVFRRLYSSWRNSSAARRRLMSRIGQLEVQIREQTSRLEDAHRESLSQVKQLATAQAEVRMARAYAASAAHDINNALGPARSGIEDVFHALQGGTSEPEYLGKARPAAQADVLAVRAKEKMTQLGEIFERRAGDLASTQRADVMAACEYLAHVGGLLARELPLIHVGIDGASDYASQMNELAKLEGRGQA